MNQDSPTQFPLKAKVLLFIHTLGIAAAIYATINGDLPGVDQRWKMAIGFLILVCMCIGMSQTYRRFNPESISRDAPKARGLLIEEALHWAVALILVGAALGFGLFGVRPELLILAILFALFVAGMGFSWSRAVEGAEALNGRPVIELAAGGFGGGIRGLHVRSPLVYGMLFLALLCASLWVGRTAVTLASTTKTPPGETEKKEVATPALHKPAGTDEATAGGGNAKQKADKADSPDPNQNNADQATTPPPASASAGADPVDPNVSDPANQPDQKPKAGSGSPAVSDPAKAAQGNESQDSSPGDDDVT